MDQYIFYNDVFEFITKLNNSWDFGETRFVGNRYWSFIITSDHVGWSFQLGVSSHGADTWTKSSSYGPYNFYYAGKDIKILKVIVVIIIIIIIQY